LLEYLIALTTARRYLLAGVVFTLPIVCLFPSYRDNWKRYGRRPTVDDGRVRWLFQEIRYTFWFYHIHW